jgi:osmotically-inducible protein OsmY
MIGGEHTEQSRVRRLRRELELHPELRAEARSVSIEPTDTGARLFGEVETITAKRLIPRYAAHIFPGGVVDALRVRSRVRADDAEHAETLLGLLEAQSEFSAYELRAAGASVPTTGNDHGLPAIATGVRAGRVYLRGKVRGLTHRRLAEALAWWTPATSDVDNRLYVDPPEMDTDDRITEAVRLVLEKDHWLPASHLNVRTRARRVRLNGILATIEQREIAGRDAWLVVGVEDVVNGIVVDKRIEARRH